MEQLHTKKFLAKINIMTHNAILDRQGRVVTETMPKLGLEGIKSIRIGKHVVMNIISDSMQEAEVIVEKACKEVLVNHVMEFYNYKIIEL